ncbi:MAG TPA: transglycosylase domain-containing protein [Candidatus Saccharimonadales bacterium]|nr:transglycosylase domain-containing protein [Candidatus Saccharimonadales bacterium]
MKKLLLALLTLVVLGGGVFGGVLLWAQSRASHVEIPSLEPAGASVVLAADGKQIVGKFVSAEAGKPLDAKQVSTLIRHAHLAAEDRSFYAHGAISLKGMAWAMLTNARDGTLAAGGSTITQQLAKRYAGTDKTFDRKIDELPYAYKMEQDYTKDQILVTYCNVNYYGRGAYGIEDAANTWFGVSATKLSDMSDPLQVARAAFLASLLKQPGNYEQYVGEPRNLKFAEPLRQRVVYTLDGLRDLEALPAGADGKPAATVSQEVVDKAKKLVEKDLSALKLTNRFKQTGSAVEGDPYLMGYVRDWIVAWQTQLARDDGYNDQEAAEMGEAETKTMLARGGLRLQTEIDPAAQDRLVSAHKNKLGGGPSGFIVLNPRTGGVVAMSGGRNYNSDPNNYAVYTKRPPGSTMKPFVLANAVKEGVSVKSVFAAPAEIRIDGPPIQDHTRKDAPGCKMTLADSIAVSNNVVAVEAATGKMASCDDRNKLTNIKDYPVTPKTVAALIRKAGAEASMVPGRTDKIKIGEEPRLAIGATLEISPLKLAVMASTLANGGEYHKPHLINRIDAPNGENIFEHEDESQQVIDRKYADIVNQVLTGVFTKGTATGAQVDGHPLAGKTGTTDTDLGDAWFFAFNAVNPSQDKEPAYACAGWAGKNADRHGADVGEVCQSFYQGQLKGRPGVKFPDADLNAGKLVGIVQAAPPPPPVVETTQPQPEPSKTTPPATPTKTKTVEPTTASTTTRPPDPGPTSTREAPPPEENGGNEEDPNNGTVPVPGGVEPEG